MRGGGKGDVSLQRGWKAMGSTEGAERGRGLSGVTFHAHLETQMADGQQNRFPGVRSFAHLGGAGGHTEGWEGRWAIPRGWEGRWAYTEGVGRATCLYEGREGRWAIPRGREGRGGSTEGVERGSTGAWEGGVEIIVEKFGKRWNKMEKYS